MRFSALVGFSICVGCHHSSDPPAVPPPSTADGGQSIVSDDAGEPAPDADQLASVLTQHGDAQRTGANLQERVLTHANVSPATFGKLFTRDVDGYLYAQPLYVANLAIGGARRNVVYLASEHNSVYAYDADDPLRAAPLWQVTLGPSAPCTDPPMNVCNDLVPEVGITSTPVIDRQASTLFVAAKTKENGAWFYRLHALELTTGAERPGSPVEIRATIPGTGDMIDGGMVTFYPRYQLNRPALLLSQGRVYLAFGSHCDTGPYHGWVFAYDAATLAQVGVYNDTANGVQGSFWQSGQGPAADEHGNVYLVSGNGDVEPMLGGLLSESFIKLSPSLGLLDWFTPYNYDLLNQLDADLGSAGVLLVPGTNLMISGGKEGKLYLVDRTHMSHFHAGVDQVVQTVPLLGARNIHGTPVHWQGPQAAYLYVWAEYDHLKQFLVGDGTMSAQSIAQSPMAAPDGMPGGFLTVSADGQNAGTGIVWAAHPLGNANPASVPGILRAFDANDVSQELWNSEELPARDSVGRFAKFCAPTVANGKVYLSTFSGVLAVYGLLGK